jgi:hypothetical protein
MADLARTETRIGRLMIAWREIDDADPSLAFSPLVRGIKKTCAWIGEHGSIPLDAVQGVQAGVRALGRGRRSTGPATPRRTSSPSTRC